MPVRAGKLFLPTVHANLLPTSSAARPNGTAGHTTASLGNASATQKASVNAEDETGLVCETFVVNAAETVDVLPAGKTRTVLVPIVQREGWEA